MTLNTANEQNDIFKNTTTMRCDDNKIPSDDLRKEVYQIKQAVGDLRKLLLSEPQLSRTANGEINEIKELVINVLVPLLGGIAGLGQLGKLGNLGELGNLGRLGGLGQLAELPQFANLPMTQYGGYVNPPLSQYSGYGNPPMTQYGGYVNLPMTQYGGYVNPPMMQYSGYGNPPIMQYSGYNNRFPNWNETWGK